MKDVRCISYNKEPYVSINDYLEVLNYIKDGVREDAMLVEILQSLIDMTERLVDENSRTTSFEA